MKIFKSYYLGKLKTYKHVEMDRSLIIAYKHLKLLFRLMYYLVCLLSVHLEAALGS